MPHLSHNFGGEYFTFNATCIIDSETAYADASAITASARKRRFRSASSATQ
jgi:hypothetical protein